MKNPDAWFNNDFRITQIKVPRNDGTNYADYLLAGVAVSAFAVDGANRKWIGTYGAGLYLVSSDGTEILEHFTAENSPLLSNSINSLALDPTNGKLMIGTDKGLCAYQGDATPAFAQLEAQNVKVYPNPVQPDYYGDVIISGLTQDADIKITTTAGIVVASGRSIGGTFRWNAKDFNGFRVRSGVYFVLIATANAKQGIVAKVAVI